MKEILEIYLKWLRLCSCAISEWISFINKVYIALIEKEKRA